MTPEAVKLGVLPEPTVTLTQEQVDAYRRDGYLTLGQISPPDEVEKLAAIYDRLFQQQAGRADGNQFDLGGTSDDGKQQVLPQILNPVRYAPELAYGLFRANALAIARQLLGPAAHAHGEHAIFKPPFHGAATPWHQDEAYWNPALAYDALSVWMPLQPATTENGCMQFVPGSHRGEIVPHHSINHDPRIHGLEVDEPPADAAAVRCPLPPGGCTVHHNRTLHYAGPNRSDVPRRAYILVFGVPPTPRAVAQDFPWQRAQQAAREQRVAAAAAAAPTTA
jgi:ectoine hydroxylase-related dioxygenase (phytanoyl-CoA dioxygenase family)